MSTLRKIQGVFYEEYKTCFPIKLDNDTIKWHRIDNGKIGLNCETNEYDLIERLTNAGLTEVLIDIVDSKPVYGWTKINPCLTVNVKSHFNSLNVDNIKRKLHDLKRNITDIQTYLTDDKKTAHDYIMNRLLIDRMEQMPGMITKVIFENSQDYQDYIQRNRVSRLKIIERCKLDYEHFEKELKELTGVVMYEAICESKEKAKELGFTDSFVHPKTMFLKSNLSVDNFKKIRQFNFVNYNFKLDYNANTTNSAFKKILSNYHHRLDTTRKMTSKSYKLAKAIGDYSIGIEFETNEGSLDEQDLSILGLVPLKDSSVGAYEYASVPYGYSDFDLTSVNTKTLAKDLVTISKACNELSSRCKINNKCSTHIHIGNVPNDKLFVIAFYKLALMLEEELFSMQPYFKHNAPEFIGSKKNYCQKFKKINFNKYNIFNSDNPEEYDDKVNAAYNAIFKIMSDGEDLGSQWNRVTKQHPKGNKWNRTQRYSWINLVNLIFNNEETIEFRLHSATTNQYKVINWILICVAMIKYCQTHTKEIIMNNDNITLNTVITGYCNNFRDKKNSTDYGLFLYSYLSNYIQERKNYFQRQYDLRNVDGADDIKNDATYKYKYDDVESLIS
jgi:hypothetical protein